jgi:hypothetical protein
VRFACTCEARRLAHDAARRGRQRGRQKAIARRCLPIEALQKQCADCTAAQTPRGAGRAPSTTLPGPKTAIFGR